MIKFGGFDKDGQALHIACVTHRYSDLPMKGLGKSMEGVGTDEPVIIPESAALEGVIWGYTEAEMERRAYELKAEIKWMELPLQNAANERKFQMWFSNPQLRKGDVMPSVCIHPITYATYTKFCPRKCLLCGEFVKQTGA